MLKNVIDHPKIFTAFAHRGETMADLEQLPELKGKKLVSMEQIHSNKLLVTSALVTSDTIPEVDALLSDNSKLALIVRVADCLPILLYHEASNTIGVIHAGRKGTELEITKNVCTKIKETTDSSLLPTLSIWLGPHICEQCYQINPETNEHYNLLRKNLNQMYEVFGKNELRLHFDGRCTAHNNDLFYSYRKEGEGVPMNYGVIAFK